MTTYERTIKRGRWLIARRRLLPVAVLAGSFVALLFATPFYIIGEWWLTALALLLAGMGVVLRAAAAQGERDFSQQATPTGIFSVMRFPKIASNLLIIASVVVYTGSVSYMILALAICYPTTLAVLMTEEQALLNRDREGFVRWSRTTNALFPKLYNWQAVPVARRSLLGCILGETRTIFLIMACLCLVNLMKNWMVEFRPVPDIPWLCVVGAAALLMFATSFRK